MENSSRGFDIGDIDIKDRLQVELYFVMVMLSFLSVTGTIGNALVLYVFYLKKDRLTSTIFILAMAFIDFLTCLLVIPFTIYMEYIRFYIKSDFLCKLYQFMITSSIPYSAFIMVAIAIDRYFCICHPFVKAITLFRAKLLCVCLGIFATGIGIIVSLMYGVYQEMPVPQFFPHNDSIQTIHPLPAQTDTTQNVATDLSLPEKNSNESLYIINEITHKSSYLDTVPSRNEIVFDGHCEPSFFILTEKFMLQYQKFYTALFTTCFVIVVILYSLIYRSVLARRTRRQKSKSKSLAMVMSTTDCKDCPPPTEDTELTLVNGGDESSSMREKSKKGGKSKRKSTKKDKNSMANLKTAFMLFVVTVAFVVTYSPAFLMALQILTYNVIVFYMYFANNVVNPVIYAFMNKNFRDDLRKLFLKRSTL